MSAVAFPGDALAIQEHGIPPSLKGQPQDSLTRLEPRQPDEFVLLAWGIAKIVLDKY